MVWFARDGRLTRVKSAPAGHGGSRRSKGAARACHGWPQPSRRSKAGFERGRSPPLSTMSLGRPGPSGPATAGHSLSQPVTARGTFAPKVLLDLLVKPRRPRAEGARLPATAGHSRPGQVTAGGRSPPKSLTLSQTQAGFGRRREPARRRRAAGLSRLRRSLPPRPSQEGDVRPHGPTNRW